MENNNYERAKPLVMELYQSDNNQKERTLIQGTHNKKNERVEEGNKLIERKIKKVVTCKVNLCFTRIWLTTLSTT